MKKVQNKSDDTDMLDEYDFSQGVRGKYAARYREGCKVVILDPDVAKTFHNSESMNRALRSLADIIRHQREKA